MGQNETSWLAMAKTMRSLILALALLGLMVGLGGQALSAIAALASDAELLENGGFEQGESPWQAYSGNFTVVSSSAYPGQVRSGSYAAAFASADLATKWLHQLVQVVPGGSYTFSGWAIKDDPDIANVYFRISWYASNDGTGSEISHNDSSQLSTDSAVYRSLTFSVTAPSQAFSARVKCMLVPASTGPATAYFDDLSFTGPQPILVKVTEVIDGDTIKLESGETVRYIGIDTPEQGELLYDEATNKNKELVEGKTVRLEKDVSETDIFGRLLRYVYIDGTFVNAKLVELGYAKATPYPPDTKYESVFSQLEGEAKNAGLGIWAHYTAASAGDVVINEVQYDPVSTSEAGAEWLELFNTTDHEINLTGWRIADNFGSDEIPDLTLLPGGYAVVAATGEGFLANFPNFTGDIVFLFDGRIGNGLNNDGDCLVLQDGLGNNIDALSYGVDTTIMNPSCQTVAEGHSLERQPAGYDTDQASDFIDNPAPSPGQELSSASPAPESDGSDADNGHTSEDTASSGWNLRALVWAPILALVGLACLILSFWLMKRR